MVVKEEGFLGYVDFGVRGGSVADVEEEDVGMVFKLVSCVEEFVEFGVAGSQEEDCGFGHFVCIVNCQVGDGNIVHCSVYMRIQIICWPDHV